MSADSFHQIILQPLDGGSENLCSLHKNLPYSWLPQSFFLCSPAKFSMLPKFYCILLSSRSCSLLPAPCSLTFLTSCSLLCYSLAFKHLFLPLPKTPCRGSTWVCFPPLLDQKEIMRKGVIFKNKSYIVSFDSASFLNMQSIYFLGSKFICCDAIKYRYSKIAFVTLCSPSPCTKCSQGNYLIKRKPLSMYINDISAYTSDVPIAWPSVSPNLSCNQASFQIFGRSQFSISDKTFIFRPICKIAYTSLT